MSLRSRSAIVLLWLAATAYQARAFEPSPPPAVAEQPESADGLARQVYDIFRQQCIKCHGVARAGGLDLRSEEGLRKGGSGMFDDVLIVWHGEFGRLPISERMDGRDHNNRGFSVWLAGGGIKGGTVVGTIDRYGYAAAENPKSVYELHATILHILGLDFEKLTYRFNGRDMRLTDVHGRVIKEILV